MESRDFGRDGAAAGVEVEVEEEGILPVTASLAKDSALLFQSRRFKECADVLASLLAKKNDDPKVIHNIAVVEYFKDGCSDPKKLLNVLNSVKKNSKELAHASGEQAEISDSVGSSIVSGPRGNGTSHQFSVANIGSIAYADEFDTSIMKLNMAVVFNSLHDYSSALSLLKPLYCNIEPIDETTALHVCLLLLDVALASKDVSRAADLIQYLERAFGVGNILSQEDNGVTAHHSSSNQSVKVSASSSGIVVSEGPDSSSVIHTSETAPTGTLSDSIEYENLLSRLDDCDSGDSLNRQCSNDIPRTPTDMLVPAIDLKLKLQLYKVRFLILARNLKVAKREIKIAMNNSRGKDSSMALLLKAQLEYARGNDSKAIKLLGNRTELKFSSMLDNNLGCIFHQQKKYNLSTMMFSKALKSSSSLLKQKPLTLHTYSQDKSFLIVYNCGLGKLFSGQLLAAASCFKKASEFLYKEPILWLRYAECCLLTQEGFLNFDGSSFSQAEKVQVHVLGYGKWRHLEIKTNSRNALAKDNSLATKDCQFSVSVPLARRCLLNALHLLNIPELISSKGGGNPTTDAEEDRSTEVSGELSVKNSTRKSIPNSDSQEIKAGLASNSNIFLSSVSSFEDMSREENRMIMQAVLANLAYVELCLENPSKALSVAKTLQKLPNCSEIYIFLSCVYAAEALCLLNQPMEAAKILSVYVTDGTIDPPYSDEDMDMLHLEKGGDAAEDLNSSASTITTQNLEFLKSQDARGVLYINLASLSVMEGDIDKAANFIKKGISIIPDNPHALLAAVYIDLLIGKTEAAVMRLKHSNRVIFHPSIVESSN